MALVWIALTSLLGCGTINGARPLAPGQHELGATIGGPMIRVGGLTLPLPQVNLEGRHGLPRVLEHEMDINWGLNGAAIAFGILQAHVGASYILIREDGWIPAISVTDRIYAASNVFGLGSRPDGALGFWALNQFEITVSYLFGDQLVYLAFADYVDFRNPTLLLAPALGVSLDPGDTGGLRFQIETRYYGIGRRPETNTFDWWPGSVGALGIMIGGSYQF